MLDGKELQRPEAPARSCALGVGHVPQGRGTLNDLTVEDNLLAGAYVRSDSEVGSDIERWYDDVPAARERRTQPPAACPAASSRCWPSLGR